MALDAKALLKRIQLKTKNKLNTQYTGEYKSAFKGFGLLFDAVREYQYGDDIRNIDWNVSARMNHLYIKEYIEERELNIVLMIDMSGSMEFGGDRSKKDILMEVVTLFLYLAQMNNDRISVLLFTGKVEWFFTPKKGRKYILKVLNDIIKFKPESKDTDIGQAIDFLMRVLKKRSIILPISDYLDDQYLLKLKRLRRKHDVIPVHISDPMESEFRFFGLTHFVDLETDESFYSDTFPALVKEASLQGFDAIELSTSEPVEDCILKFFQKRNKEKKSRW